MKIQYIGVLAIILFLGAGCYAGNTIEDDKSVESEAEMEVQETVITLDGSGDSDSAGISITATPVGDDEEAEGPLEPLYIDLYSGNFYFTPSSIQAKPGQEIIIENVENEGFHTFVIDELGIKEQLGDGNVIRFTAPEQPGDYLYYCDIGSHRELGQEGVLRVVE